MTELAERYRKAEMEVLQRYASDHSQEWKVQSIQSDREKKVDSRLLQSFAEDVESIVNQFEKKINTVVKKLCKQACDKPKKSIISTGPAMPHGIDLDWN